jgi:sulfide:quinone oxidoreductase
VSEAKERAVKKIVILGAGFGGLETATGLAVHMNAHMKAGYEITLIDRSDSFFVGFSKVDVLFGRRSESEVRSRYADLRATGVRFVQASITAIDTDARSVTTNAGEFGYDYLVVALGAELDLAATPGYLDAGSHEFYSMAGVTRLKPVLEAFSEGKLVLGILGVPYKCPPAPYEVACQIHERFVKRGVRERIELSMVIPGARPVPYPAVADALEKLLLERDIRLVRNAPIRSIDAANRRVPAGDVVLDYDLFIGVPVHVPPAVVRSSKLGAAGFIQPDPTSLETSVPNVYAVGDVTKLAAGEVAVPKAGAFAEDAARTVVAEILVKEGLASQRVKFEAQGACYFEVGGGQVAKVNANFYGGDKPVQSVEGPAAEFLADKHGFETERRARWFR